MDQVGSGDSFLIRVAGCRLTGIGGRMVLTALLLSSLPASATTLFWTEARFAEGGLLRGVLGINTSTGAIASADWYTSLPTPYRGINRFVLNPNFDSGPLLVSLGQEAGYPLSLLGIDAPSLSGYAGGSLAGASSVTLADGTEFAVQNARLTQTSSTVSAGRTLTTFAAAGVLDHPTLQPGSLGGTVVIDTTNGRVESTDLTVTVPVEYRTSSNVGQTPSTVPDRFAIAADNNSNLPVAVIRFVADNLIGFDGATLTSGALSSGVDVFQLTSGTVFPLVAGDYNNDGSVDAADYTVWRDRLEGGGWISNDATPATVAQEDLVVWQNKYGTTAAATAVPEPGAAAATVVAVIAVAWRRPRS